MRLPGLAASVSESAPRFFWPRWLFLRALGPVQRFWYAPDVLWLGASDRALTFVVGAGLVGSVLLIPNVWPRATVALCSVRFLSCISVLEDFSSYSSHGMLLEAGFIS